MKHHHHQNCGCQKPVKQIVHPVKKNVVHHCTEEMVKHVHPSHTTVMNHHLIKNKHVYPHSTSVQNTMNSVDIYGGSFNTPTTNGPGPGNQVAGAMNQNNYGMGKYHGHGSPYSMKHHNKPHKWC